MSGSEKQLINQRLGGRNSTNCLKMNYQSIIIGVINHEVMPGKVIN